MLHQNQKKGNHQKRHILYAKKSLGQNFLKNKNAIAHIINALDIADNDTIIEIGPGRGALTIPLYERAQNKKNITIRAIEKDETLAQALREKFQTTHHQSLTNPSIEIIDGDILKIISSHIPRGRYKIVGNIPYYITGKLLRIISELPHKPERTILMVQKEVAERICAQPPNMNLLSAITQFWAEPSIIMRLASTDFNPAPKVDSAIIQLVTKQTPSNVPAQAYYDFVKILFKQPRKTVINNLKQLPHITRYDILSIMQKKRPEELSIVTIMQLFKNTGL